MRGRLILGLLFGGMAMYVSSCTYVSKVREASFQSVEMGDHRSRVIEKFGSSYFSEPESQDYKKYTGVKCKLPCVSRLWHGQWILMLRSMLSRKGACNRLERCRALDYWC